MIVRPIGFRLIRTKGSGSVSLTEGDGRTSPEHFDPKMLDAFVRVAPEFDRIFEERSG